MTTYPNPGAVGDVVGSTTIETTWGDAIRDRVVNNFATGTARDAAITSPVLGMVCYVAGTGLLQYCGATDGWRPPWNLPWGYVNDATQSTNGAANSGTATVLGVTFTAVANRIYKVTAKIEGVTQVGAGTSILLIANGTTAIDAINIAAAAIAAGPGESLSTIVKGLTAGSTTMNLRTLTTATTVQAVATDVNAATIFVEDIGPNGNPS